MAAFRVCRRVLPASGRADRYPARLFTVDQRVEAEFRIYEHVLNAWIATRIAARATLRPLRRPGASGTQDRSTVASAHIRLSVSARRTCPQLQLLAALDRDSYDI